nr:MAG TPA: hypothetical protein [Caudoviricetes sp.]
MCKNILSVCYQFSFVLIVFCNFYVIKYYLLFSLA